MLRNKYGPVMAPVPPKRYKFKRTLICSPAETKMIEEAKRQRLAQEAEEAATGIKRPHLIAYSSHTTNVDPSCDGRLCPFDLSLPLVSDYAPPSWQNDLDAYQQRRAAAVAALEAAAAARPPRPPRLYIDPQMNVLRIYRQDEAALPAAAATGTKVQAECVGAGLKRPCDDSNSGTSDSSESNAASVAL